MVEMRACVLVATLTLGVASVSGCGTGTSGGGDGDPGDGGNPARCPASAPAGGAPCTSPALRCTYGCNTIATCTGGAWSVVSTRQYCVEGGVLDGAGHLPDGAITCGTDSDCPSQLFCSPGGVASGCGICAVPQHGCNTSADCALFDGSAPPVPMVCGPLYSCTCPTFPSSGQCIPACTSTTGCTADESCASSGLCVAKSCKSDADCPGSSDVDYACTMGACAEKTCKTDADCGAHYCVTGICYPKQGVCVPPAA